MDGAMGGGSAAARLGAASRVVRARPARRSMSAWLDRQFARLAVLPTTVLMLLVFGLPLLFSLYLSFQGWSPDQALFGGRFTGTDNYQDLLTAPAACSVRALPSGTPARCPADWRSRRRAAARPDSA